MFSSSAIHVIEQTGDRLVVTDPPYYTLGWCLVGLALVTLVFRYFVSASSTHLWPGFLLAVPFLLAGVGLLTSDTTFTFSRSAGTVVIDKRTFGIVRPVREVPLRNIQSARVETGRNSRRLVLVLESGGTIPMGTLTSQQGQFQAANAINRILGKAYVR
jgi:hypothetical protein